MLNQGVWSQSIKCYQLAVQLVNERCWKFCWSQASLRSLNPFVILKITRFSQKLIMFLPFRPYALCIYDPITPQAFGALFKKLIPTPLPICKCAHKLMLVTWQNIKPRISVWWRLTPVLMYTSVHVLAIWWLPKAFITLCCQFLILVE